VDGKEFLNERAIATQQTGFVFVSQSRERLPGPIGGLLWFGVDDAATNVFMPVYAGLREVPKSLDVRTATLHRFSWDSAFWIFNWVANQTYARYSDMVQDVRRRSRSWRAASSSARRRSRGRRRACTRTPRSWAATTSRLLHPQVEVTMARWRQLGEDLLVKYMDGNVKDEQGKVLHPPYPESWYRRILAESPDHFAVQPGVAAPPSPRRLRRWPPLLTLRPLLPPPAEPRPRPPPHPPLLDGQAGHTLIILQ
jgi:hypothetical protein